MMNNNSSQATIHKTILLTACTLSLLIAGTSALFAQSSSLYRQGMPIQSHQPVDLQQGSWTFIPVPQPKKLDLYDVVVVRVDELARMQAEGEMERRKNASYDAVLQDWLSFDGLKALRPNAQGDGDPRVRGSLQQLFRAESDLKTRESLTLDIACHIVDMRPNGNIALEGHREIRVNENVWEVSLSGICRREDIGPDSTILSRQIVHLKLHKREHGHVRDGYKRGWLLRWIDEFHPF